MRNALVWTLAGLGLLAMLFGLSYSWTGSWTGSTTETVVRIGFPDAWFEKTTQSNGSQTSVNLLTWSFGSLMIGVVAIGAAVKISRNPKPTAGKA